MYVRLGGPRRHCVSRRSATKRRRRRPPLCCSPPPPGCGTSPPPAPRTAVHASRTLDQPTPGSERTHLRGVCTLLGLLVVARAQVAREAQRDALHLVDQPRRRLVHGRDREVGRHHLAQAVAPSIFRNKNRRCIGRSQPKRPHKKTAMARAPPRPSPRRTTRRARASRCTGSSPWARR
jgi:hypothetical protein